MREIDVLTLILQSFTLVGVWAPLSVGLSIYEEATDAARPAQRRFYYKTDGFSCSLEFKKTTEWVMEPELKSTVTQSPIGILVFCH